MDISKAAGARKEDRDEGVDSSFLVVPASCFDVVEEFLLFVDHVCYYDVKISTLFFSSYFSFLPG